MPKLWKQQSLLQQQPAIPFDFYHLTSMDLGERKEAASGEISVNHDLSQLFPCLVLFFFCSVCNGN